MAEWETCDELLLQHPRVGYQGSKTTRVGRLINGRVVFPNLPNLLSDAECQL